MYRIFSHPQFSNGVKGLPGPAHVLGTQDTESRITPLTRKVLVVDDEADLADLAAALLSAHGLETVVVNSAYEAIQVLAADSEIDAVFSDVVMPGMTGIELADAVKAMYPKVKIVLASGYAQPSVLRGREQSYLFTTKPYKIDTILKLLHS